MEQNEHFPSSKENQSEDILPFFITCLEQYCDRNISKTGKNTAIFLRHLQQTITALVQNTKIVNTLSTLSSPQAVRNIAYSLAAYLTATDLFAGETIDATITSSVSWIKISVYAVITGSVAVGYALQKEKSNATNQEQRIFLKNLQDLQPLFPANAFILKKMKNTVCALVERGTTTAWEDIKETIQQYYTDIVFEQKGIILRLLNNVYAPQSAEKENIEELLMLHHDKENLMAAQQIIFQTLQQERRDESERQKIQQLSQEVDTLIYMLEHIEREKTILIQNINAIEQAHAKRKKRKHTPKPVSREKEPASPPSPSDAAITDVQEHTQEQIEEYISLSPLSHSAPTAKEQQEKDLQEPVVSVSPLVEKQEEKISPPEAHSELVVTPQGNTNEAGPPSTIIPKDTLPYVSAEVPLRATEEPPPSTEEKEQATPPRSSSQDVDMSKEQQESEQPPHPQERRTLPLMNIDDILRIGNDFPLTSEKEPIPKDSKQMEEGLPSLRELEERFQQSNDLYTRCHKRERRIMTQISMEDLYEKYQKRITSTNQKIKTLLEKNKRLKTALEKNDLTPAILESDQYATYAKLVSSMRKDLEQWEKILKAWRKMLLSKSEPQ